MSKINISDGLGEPVECEESEVKALLEKGLLDSNSMCWKDGMSDWKPLHVVFDVKSNTAIKEASNVKIESNLQKSTSPEIQDDSSMFVTIRQEMDITEKGISNLFLRLFGYSILMTSVVSLLTIFIFRYFEWRFLEIIVLKLMFSSSLSLEYYTLVAEAIYIFPISYYLTRLFFKLITSDNFSSGDMAMEQACELLYKLGQQQSEIFSNSNLPDSSIVLNANEGRQGNNLLQVDAYLDKDECIEFHLVSKIFTVLMAMGVTFCIVHFIIKLIESFPKAYLLGT